MHIMMDRPGRSQIEVPPVSIYMSVFPKLPSDMETNRHEVEAGVAAKWTHVRGWAMRDDDPRLPRRLPEGGRESAYRFL